jgi:hypothetical protein
MICIGVKVFIKYNGDTVHFGQCYDGMTGIIDGYIDNRYRVSLDAKSRKKINEINYRFNTNWVMDPNIPFQYVYVYNKSLELE